MRPRPGKSGAKTISYTAKANKKPVENKASEVAKANKKATKKPSRKKPNRKKPTKTRTA